jgi:hypothetical protein
MSGPDMTDGALHRHQRSPVARDRSGHPEGRRAELTRILMAWRREVRRAKGTAGEAA